MRPTLISRLANLACLLAVIAAFVCATRADATTIAATPRYTFDMPEGHAQARGSHVYMGLTIIDRATGETQTFEVEGEAFQCRQIRATRPYRLPAGKIYLWHAGTVTPAAIGEGMPADSPMDQVALQLCH